MYAENARDSYHASLLHLFFATFKLNRLSQGGGLVVSANGGCSVSETIAPTQSDDTAYAGMRSVDDEYMRSGSHESGVDLIRRRCASGGCGI